MLMPFSFILINHLEPKIKPEMISPILFLIFSSLFINFSLSDPRATQAGLICSNKTASPPQRETFAATFLDALDAVTPLITRQQYASVLNGTGNTTVHAFGECMKDLDSSDCNLCFAQCKTQILRCRPFQLGTRGGRLFYDGCFLRYDDYNFSNETLTGQDRTVCAARDFSLGNVTVFGGNVVELVRNLSVEAPENDGFSVGSVERGNLSVYGLAQCWEFVNRSGCATCLAAAARNVSSCTPKEEGRALNAGCYLRYSTQKFYNNSGSAVAGNGGENQLTLILAITFSVVAVVLIVATAVFFAKKRIVEKRRAEKQLGGLLPTLNKTKLNLSYESLERATNYFDQSNKLGQGGSGSVYKGVLPDGTTVAIKRLFFNTRQWVEHFFNEVNLISGIHHKNLVKLLGCSITGPESLLVYEYVPNQSLHNYFFGKKNVQPLTWGMRFRIILGIAEGLAYLHEESEYRIIHRDIKLSNVLLDVDFTPKIADFGLARLFPEDKSHISTAIAGTLGYMAPEYIVRGKLSEKADIYSFGVLVIEVVTGKRNNFLSEDGSSILHMVWKLYETDRLCEVVDPILQANFDEEEASRLLRIGLLCVQASAELRPCMSAIVKMITQNHEIVHPTQPPFLNPGTSEIMMPPHTRPVSCNSQQESASQYSMTQSLILPR